MPQEIGYEQQVRPGGTATAPAQAGPDAFGAGVGAAFGQVGDVLHRGAIDRYRVERQQTADREALDFAAKRAGLAQQADKVALDDQNNPQLDPAGHAQRMAGWWQAQQDGLLNGITDDHVRREAAVSLTSMAANIGERADTWQAGEAVKKSVADAGTATQLSAGRARTDPSTAAEEIEQLHHTFAAIQYAPRSVVEKLQQEGDAAIVSSSLLGLADKGQPQTGLDALDSGKYNGVLSEGQRSSLRSALGVEKRRLDAQAEHQAQLQKAGISQQHEMVNARLGQGEVVPDGELATLQGQLRAIGDEHGAYEIGAAREKAGLNKETQPWTPLQYQQHIDQLSALGDRRTPAQDRQLHQLQEIAPERIKGFNEDPGNWAALNGNPRPAFNPADPGSVGALQRWAGQVQRVTGVAPPPFGKEQAAQLHQIATRGTADERVALAGSLAALGPELMMKARDQIGGDKDFAAAITLGARPTSGALIAMALGGAKAQDPVLLKPAKPEAGMPQTEPDFDETFRRDIGGSLGLIGDDAAATIKTNARNLYFYYAKQTGAKAFEPTLAQRALRETLGSKLAWWGGDRVVLPGTMTADSFQRRLGQATRENWRTAAAGGQMPWTNGGEMTPAEMQGYVPTRLTSGAYRLRKGQGAGATYAATKSGAPFEFDPAKLWDGPRLSAESEAPPLPRFASH